MGVADSYAHGLAFPLGAQMQQRRLIDLDAAQGTIEIKDDVNRSADENRERNHLQCTDLLAQPGGKTDHSGGADRGKEEQSEDMVRNPAHISKDASAQERLRLGQQGGQRFQKAG